MASSHQNPTRDNNLSDQGADETIISPQDMLAKRSGPPTNTTRSSYIVMNSKPLRNPSTTAAMASSEQSHNNQEPDMTTLTSREPPRKKCRPSPSSDSELGNPSLSPQEAQDVSMLEKVHSRPENAVAIEADCSFFAGQNQEDDEEMVAPPATSGSQVILAWLEQVRSRAKESKDEGDLMLARAYLQEATPIAFRAADEGMCTRSYLCEHFISQLADTCYQLGDFEEAVDHYTTAVQQERLVGEPPNRRPLKYLDAICNIYVEVRQYSYALCVFKEVYDLQVELMGPNSLEVGATLCNMGLMHYLLDMYTPALHFYQETLRISLNHLEACNRQPSKNVEPLPPKASLHKSTGDALNAMGLLYFKLRRYEEAKSAFGCALSIRENMLGPYHKDCIVMWYNLAMVQIEMGDPRRAIPLCEEGIRRERIARETDKCHAALSHTLQYLGEIHNQLGDIDNSLKCFEEALEIEKKQAIMQGTKQNNNHWPIVCRLLNVIGNIHLMQANIPATMKCFEEAARTSAMLVAMGDTYIPLVVAGHMFCHLTRTHPNCAPAA